MSDRLRAALMRPRPQRVDFSASEVAPITGQSLAHDAPPQSLLGSLEGAYRPSFGPGTPVGWGMTPDEQHEVRMRQLERYQSLSNPLDPASQATMANVDLVVGLLGGALVGGAAGKMAGAIRGRMGAPGARGWPGGIGGNRSMIDARGAPMPSMARTEIMPQRLPAATALHRRSSTGTHIEGMPPPPNAMRDALSARSGMTPVARPGARQRSMEDDLPALPPPLEPPDPSHAATWKYDGPDAAELARKFDDEWWANHAANPPPKGRSGAELDRVDPLPPLPPPDPDVLRMLLERSASTPPRPASEFPLPRVSGPSTVPPPGRRRSL